jgi:tetratricopeptide (TPR) repeat protein
VPVYATGEEDGTHFYAMELIEGPSLDHVIRQIRAAASTTGPVSTPSAHGNSPSSDLAQTGPYVEGTNIAGASSGLTSSSLGSGGGYFDTVARMIAEVADALNNAHTNGVIHRDMKPSNLLLSPAGRLSVNDFGLARMLEQPGMTMTGEFVGTPAYMSPEQIAAGRIPLDHRTDIYSLGATLYELLTLEPPFTGNSREQVLAQIVHKEPKALRRIQKKVPVDLETICLKCLEKDPDRRYQTAGAMAEDLRRYGNRFAISARRAGPVQRLVKWVKRRPAVAASLGCVLVAVCVALGFAYQAHRAEQQRTEEKERHRLQLMDEKISKAYMIAASGDMGQTDEAIKEIEQLGGSTGQVRLLRGMVAYFRADYQTAVSDLEQAVKLLPGSVTGHALLSASYGGTGQFERSVQLLTEMKSLSPSSPEDYLFKGHAQESNREDGLANLNEGIRLSNSPLGRALRAQAWATRAFDTRDLEAVANSLEDAKAALGMAPDNPLVLEASILCRVIASVIYKEARLPEKGAAVLKEAKQNVRKFEPFLNDRSNAFFPVCFFYDENGEKDKALAVTRAALRKSWSPSAASLCAINLYCLDRFEEALQCLERREHTDLVVDITRAIVLAEIGPNGHLRALEEYEKMTRDASGSVLAAWTDILLLLGRKDQAVALLQKLDKGDLYDQVEWEFARGELSQEQYLAKSGASHFMKANAHYHLGLFRLATGDREGARDHFKEGARPTWGYAVHWSRMLLSRMDKDKNWPPWIQSKKDQRKP